MKIGFIGFGKLGQSIITRLLSTGAELCLWNRNKDKLRDINSTIANTPRELAESSSLIFICLFDSSAVDSVFTMPDGILSTNIKDKTIVDLSTNHYNTVVDFHKYCEDKGANYVEAPVLGSVAPALKGMLTVLVSGKEKAYKKAKPYIEKIGKHIFFLEKPGLASKMKVINNFVLGNFMVTLAESLSFGEEIGIDKDRFLDILSKGGGDSLVLNAKKEKLIKGDFSTHFSSALIYKDLNCLYDLAYELKKPLLTASLTKELYAKTFQMNISDLDFSAVYKLFDK